MILPTSVSIVEVGPRDGFQLEPEFVPTDLKVAVIDAVAGAGVKRIEATSFVSPRLIPQMRDAEEVMRRVPRRAGCAYSALVPNPEGARRAIAAGVDVLRVVFSATDEANRKNIRRTVEESLVDLEAIVQLASRAARTVEVIIGMAFGCPLTGPVPEARVAYLVDRVVALGPAEVFLADSYGFADPLQVVRLVRRLRGQRPDLPLGLHLHNTRGLALANAYAAMGEGLASFDASLGGLGAGGLGTAGPASGNICTEDLVNLCEECGIATGIDVDRLVVAAHRIRDFLGRPLPGRVQAAGTRTHLFTRIARRGASA
jgi:hydroxymethylglutaryl-CoA lyase